LPRNSELGPALVVAASAVVIAELPPLDPLKLLIRRGAWTRLLWEMERNSARVVTFLVSVCDLSIALMCS